jgi:hypothetical protein
MINKITVSLAATEEELWKTSIEMELGFDHIEEVGDGSLKAVDTDGQVMSLYVPSVAEVSMPVTVDNMNTTEQLTGTPDGERAIVEQNPTNIEINVNQTGRGTIPVVPGPGTYGM